MGGISRHATFEEAVAELKRLAALPWGEEPNAPNCGRLECGCRFDIVEYDASDAVRRIPALKRSAGGGLWLAEISER